MGVTAGTASAQGLAPIDRGWWGVDGSHEPANYNYYVGNGAGTPALTYRNWFAFDLGCVSGPVSSASLVLEMPDNGFSSVHASETYSLFDVSTPVPDLIGALGGATTYNDLGSGTSYGAVVVTAADNGLEVAVPLNAAGLAAINGNVGGLVAFGGALTTLDGDTTTTERAFSGSTDWAVRLVLDPACDVRDAVDRGWYAEDGTHHPTNLNYIVGNCASCAGGDTFRNFFVFDVDALGGLVTGATLALENPYNHVSPDASETYQLFEVSTETPFLLDASAGASAFADLGSGDVYGSYELTGADGGSLVQVPLSGTGLVALNEGTAGGEFVVGGAITTLDADPSNHEVSFSSGSPVHCISQMQFEVEPAWAWLGGGTEGALGQPLLLGSGSLEAGTLATVSLSGAPANAPMLAWFTVSPPLTPTPFAALGGTVHAFPYTNQLFFFADAGGAWVGATPWPAGIPSGTQVTFQFIVQDFSSIHGLTLSNGLLATTP